MTPFLLGGPIDAIITPLAWRGGAALDSHKC